MSGKLAGAVIALLLGLVLAITYPSEQSEEASAKAEVTAQKSLTRPSAAAPRIQRQSIAKLPKRVVPKVPVKEEEEEGC